MTNSKSQKMHTDEEGFAFLQFYKKLGYKIIPGSSMLDPSVPMTFVMSAGLAQVETSAKLSDGRKENRYALIQNCFRYFDMEHIGNSPVHLSFFQMPGAFSFTPLPKEECIFQIWNLLTEVYGFAPQRLWATYFSGDVVCGHSIPADTETQKAWHSVGMASDRVVGLNAEHNFWKQSANVVGESHVPKCGVHTEVFFDRGKHLQCGKGCLPGCNCGRFVEIMNTLFITLHIDDQTGMVRPLEEPFTETVIGSERVSMLVQNVPTVYEIDSIYPLLQHIKNYADPSNLSDGDLSKHLRIITDHIRAIVFLTADGAPTPGKGGRARLMRKLVREMLTSARILCIEDDFIDSLPETVFVLYGGMQARLLNAKAKVADYIDGEKERFEHTLKAGFRRIDHIRNFYMPGTEIVKLEKNHGIPHALLMNQLKMKKIQYSIDDYRVACKQWKQDMTI